MAKYTKRLFIIIAACLFLTGCSSANINSGNDKTSGTRAQKETNDNVSKPAESAEQNSSETKNLKEDFSPKNTLGTGEIEWPELSENGLNEELLLENIDKEALVFIAEELQTLANEIREKQDRDPESVLRGDWIYNIPESRHYQDVIDMGSRAVKPLYYIIYKSPQQGLYEWMCSLALEKISGGEFLNEAGTRWSASKEFLELYTKDILSKTK